MQHNNQVSWISSEQETATGIQPMIYEKIDIEELKAVIKNTHTWKSPEADGTHNFGYKQLGCLHEKLAQWLIGLLEHPEKTPKFFTARITYAIKK